MDVRDEKTLEQTRRQIEFILNHPDMSDWLKDTVQTALDRDPLEVLNDLEILNQLLRRRCEALIAAALERN